MVLPEPGPWCLGRTWSLQQSMPCILSLPPPIPPFHICMCGCCVVLRMRWMDGGNKTTHNFDGLLGVSCVFACVLTSLMCLYVLMRSTLSLRSGPKLGSRKWVGMRACMARMSVDDDGLVERCSICCKIRFGAKNGMVWICSMK